MSKDNITDILINDLIDRLYEANEGYCPERAGFQVYPFLCGTKDCKECWNMTIRKHYGLKLVSDKEKR